MLCVIQTVLPSTVTGGVGLTCTEVVAAAVQEFADVTVALYNPLFPACTGLITGCDCTEVKLDGPDHEYEIPPPAVSCKMFPLHTGELLPNKGVGTGNTTITPVVVAW